MSQFDLPRINFHGFTIINPGTGNNGYHLPLVYFDPVEVKALFPPRLYLSEQYLTPGTSLEEVMALLPQNTPIKQDKNHTQYIEILPIYDGKAFLQWATHPLGKCELDAHFHPLYALIQSPKSRKALKGSFPGYWNLFGDMSMSLDEVSIVSVQVEDGKGDLVTYTEKSNGLPLMVKEMLGAVLSMKDPQGRNPATMIDVLPTEASYTQIFCDHFRVLKAGKELLAGKPHKASMRSLSPDRVVNQTEILAASASFYTGIPLQQIRTSSPPLILNFLRENCEFPERLKGVFLRFNLFEVEENRDFDYPSPGATANPAKIAIAGSISPWYQGEISSFTTGRLLLPKNPISQKKKLGACIGKVNPKAQTVSLDLLSTLPELKHSKTGNPRAYEVFPLGKIDLQISIEDASPLTIGTINIHEHGFSRSKMVEQGGIVSFSYADLPQITPAIMRKGRLSLSGTSTYLEESELFIFVDQPGLYAVAGDPSQIGYLCNDSSRQPCRIRIFKRGVPVQTPIPIQALLCEINRTGKRIEKIELFQEKELKDGDTLIFPTTVATNRIYLLQPVISLRAIEHLAQTLIETGAGVHVRVLPNRTYPQYLTPNHEKHQDKIPFDFLYQELFELYERIYPMSAIISPFDETSLIQAIPHLRKLLSPSNWGSSTYMPSTRDLSPAQFQLFQKWADQNELID